MRTYSPRTGDNIAGLEKERQDSMDCGECLPLCNHVNYYVGTVSISMHSGSVEELRRAKKLGDRNDTLPVVAVVKIYHAQRRSSLYVQDVVSEWFNMLSRCPSLITSCCPWFRMDCEFARPLFQAPTADRLASASGSRCCPSSSSPTFSRGGCGGRYSGCTTKSERGTSRGG